MRMIFCNIGFRMKKYRNIYIGLVYIVFFVLFGMVGLISTFITKNEVVLLILKTLLAWTSFFVLLGMFKKIMPDKTLKQFFKEMFSERLNLKIFFSIIVIQLSIFLISVFVSSKIGQVDYLSLFNISFSSVIGGFFVQIISGPIGEEPGYRGYLFPEMNKNHSVIKSGFIVGLIWGVWHFPLWLISGFVGVELLIYCVCFLVSIVSTCVVMCITYSLNKNIINCILIHLLVNYPISSLYKGNLIHILIPFSILYFLTAIIICIIYNKKAKRLTSPTIH